MVLGLSPIASANFIWFMGIFGTIIILWTFNSLNKKAYPFEVIIHNDQTGTNNSPIADKDRARLIKIGRHGEQIYWLKKNKVARIGYGKYVGFRKIAWDIEDGVWYNVVYGKIDKKLKELGLEPLDRNVRLAAESIVQIMENKYKKNKLGKVEVIMGVIIIVMMALQGYMLYKNMQVEERISANNVQTAKEQKETQALAYESLTNFTESLKDIVAYTPALRGGSGLVPA